MNSGAGVRQGIYRSPLVRRMAHWFDTSPHPTIACEIATDHVAAAHWARRGLGLDGFAVEALPPGTIVPSAVDPNIINADAVRAAVGRVFTRLRIQSADTALFIPDAAIRVFVLHFDVFPRNNQEAIPMLRWRLKKSVPFEAEETLISYTRQRSEEKDGVDIVTGLARQRIIHEYESLLEPAGMLPGVVLSSTLASLPLLADTRSVLLVRVASSTLTTAIVRNGILSGYRCISVPADAQLTPQQLLDEVYPLAAYYQDTWKEGITEVRLAGLAERVEDFREPLERELGCSVAPLLASALTEGKIRDGERPLADRGLDSLVGWTLNRGA